MEQVSQMSDVARITASRSNLSPEAENLKALPQFSNRGPLSSRRTIRRQELRRIIPLSETTIYEMERRGEFPRRFNLAPRCVAWDLDEINAWIEARKQAMTMTESPTRGPNVRLRKTRPMRTPKRQAGSNIESD